MDLPTNDGRSVMLVSSERTTMAPATYGEGSPSASSISDATGVTPNWYAMHMYAEPLLTKACTLALATAANRSSSSL